MSRVRRVNTEERAIYATAAAQAHPTVPAWSLVLPVLVGLLLFTFMLQRPDGRLHLWVLDVGQGDAILLRTPNGRTALIDGGPGATPLLNGLGRNLPFWQRNLDLVVLTHPHADHLMGLVELSERSSLSQMVQPPFTATLGLKGAWLRLLQERRIPVHHPKAGDTLHFAGEPNVRLLVLRPRQSTPSNAADDANDNSIVLKVIYGEHTFLLMGDAPAEVEQSLVREYGAGLAASVLKVGHHGSDTSSIRPFLDRVQPAVAIISAGLDNPFGHPVAQTLDALTQTGAQIYRTDQNGTVELIADSARLWVRSDR